MAIIEEGQMATARTELRHRVSGEAFDENNKNMSCKGLTRWEGRSGGENKRKICFAIVSTVLLSIIDEASSRAITNDPPKVTIKRSPKALGIGYVSFDISTHQTSPIDYSVSPPIIQDLPHIPVSIPHQQAAIKPDSNQRGPSVSHGTVINLVGHELIQTHDHLKEFKLSDHIVIGIAEVSHHPDIIHDIIPLIQTLPHAISSSRKTSITTTNVGHVVINNDKKIPVLTHAITHTNEDVAHVVGHHNNVNIVPVNRAVHAIKFDDLDLHVIPLHGHPVEQLPRMKPVLVSWAAESRPNGNSIIPSHEASTHEDSNEDRERNPVGGYGVGISFGGQGAGHGYWAGK